MSNSLGNFSLIYNLCPKSNLSTGQKFSDLSTTNATYRFIYELQILSRALYDIFKQNVNKHCYRKLKKNQQKCIFFGFFWV